MFMRKGVTIAIIIAVIVVSVITYLVINSGNMSSIPNTTTRSTTTSSSATMQETATSTTRSPIESPSQKLSVKITPTYTRNGDWLTLGIGVTFSNNLGKPVYIKEIKLVMYKPNGTKKEWVIATTPATPDNPLHTFTTKEYSDVKLVQIYADNSITGTGSVFGLSVQVLDKEPHYTEVQLVFTVIDRDGNTYTVESNKYSL